MLFRPNHAFPYNLDGKAWFGRNNTNRICDLNSCYGFIVFAMGEVEMQKDFIDEFVKKCNKGAIEAKRAVQELSADEIIELKAELKVKSIHSDKWIVLFISFLTSVIAVLPLISEMTGANKDDIAMLGFGILVVQIIVIAVYAWNRCRKASARERAQSYLEDYSKKEQKVEKVQMQETLSIETFEQITNRQKRERELALVEWEKKRNYINEQIVLFQDSLSMSEANEQELHNETNTRC